MKRIAVLCPTWGRPERMAAFARSALELATHRERVRVWVRVACEDEAYGSYLHSCPEATLVYTRGCPGYPAGIEFLRQKAWDADLFFCGSDDSLFRTPGWDELAEAALGAFGDGLAVAYANNGLDREKCEQFFTTRQWIETVGWLMRPEYEHFCCDQDVETVAKGVGRLVRLLSITVEHMHKKYGKSPDDATYRRVRQDDPGVNDRDLATFARLAPERAAAMARLEAVMRK